MTRMHIIAKIALALIGVRLLVSLLYFTSFYMRTVGAGFQIAPFARIPAFGVTLLVRCAVVYFLVFRNDWLVKMLVGPEERSAQHADRTWLVVGFRLTLYFCGVMVLAGCIDFLISGVAFIIYGPRVLIDMIIHRYVDDIFAIGIYGWLEWLSGLCRTTLGVYLVLGAPHFVRWQMKKFNRYAGPEIIRGEGRPCP